MPGGRSFASLGSTGLPSPQCPDNTPVSSGAAIPAGLKQLCPSRLSNKGRFAFPWSHLALTKPVPYQTTATKFRGEPKIMDVTVKSGFVRLSAPFTVSGFPCPALC